MIYRAKRRCVVCGIVHAGSEFTKEQLAARNRGKLPDKKFLKDNFDLISASKPTFSVRRMIRRIPRIEEVNVAYMA
jgi:hypothetical protein